MPNGYRISEVAAKLGITPDTLRYYERLGVLPRARRTAAGLRQYGDDVLRHVRFIQQAQALGLTLKDVRQLVSDQGRGGRDRCRKVRDRAFGASMASLERYRPIFLAVTALLVGGAFYLAYRPMSACDSCSPVARRRGKITAWLAALLVVALVTFPYYVGFLF